MALAFDVGITWAFERYICFLKGYRELA